MRPVSKPQPAPIPVPGNNLPAYSYFQTVHLTGTNVTFVRGSVLAVFNQNPYTTTVDALLNTLVQRVQGINPYPAGSPDQQRKATNAIIKRLTKPDVNPPGYRSANPQLDARLGHYCSFCEIAKPGHEIEVEHRIPQTDYPVPLVWWGNFLQSCSRCNSIKKEKPNRQIAGGLPLAPARATAYANPPLPPLLPAPAPPYRGTEQILMQRILERWFWPDLDPWSIWRVRYEMQNRGNAYAAIPSPLAALRLPNNHVHFVNYTITANLMLGGGPAITPNVGAEIVALVHQAFSLIIATDAATDAATAAAAAATALAARDEAGKAATDTSTAVGRRIYTAANAVASGGGAPTPAMVAAACNQQATISQIDAAYQAETQRTLALTGLERQNSARSGYRTRAWFKILARITKWERTLAVQDVTTSAIPAITSVQADALKKDLFDTFWDGLLSSAAEVGFYSTLIELLRQIPHPAYAQPAYALGQAAPPAPVLGHIGAGPFPPGFITLAHRFVYESNPANIANTGVDEDQTIPGTDVTNIVFA